MENYVPMGLRRGGKGETPHARHRTRIPISLTSLPIWVWLAEALGVGLVVAAGLTNGFLQSLGLAMGTALMLALPVGALQASIEERLAVKIEKVVSESVLAAASKRLSGAAVPIAPEDLDLWPFTALTEPPSGSRIRLRLWSTGSVMSSLQPIEVLIVVTDPIGRTFSTDRKLQTVVEKSVTNWTWPDEFTSGDIQEGTHSVEFFVAPLSAGPARRFGLAAQAGFEYHSSGPGCLG